MWGKLNREVMKTIVEGILYLVPNRPRTFEDIYWDFQRNEIKQHLEEIGITFKEDDLFIDTNIWTVDGEKELTCGWGLESLESLPDCMPISFLRKFKEGDTMIFLQNNKEYHLKIDHLSHYEKYGPFEKAIDEIPAQWERLMEKL